MDPKYWGPSSWKFLHSIAANYPNNPSMEDKHIYKSFFISLKDILPCNRCKENYKKNLLRIDINKSLNSKKDFIFWVIDLHNLVNEETDKKKLSYNSALEKINLGYNKNCFDVKTIIILLLILLIILLLLKKKKIF